jgi:2-iminobutanoate/2-iminopropanoate deaminase
MREIIRTHLAPVFALPLSQGIKFGQRVFPSGMVGVKPGSQEEILDFPAQVRQVMDNLLSVASAGGMEPEDFVKCSVFLKDMNYFGIFNRIYAEYFHAAFPARSAFEIPSLAGPFALEVEGFGFAGKMWQSSPKEIIRTNKAPRFQVPLVQGVKVGNFIYPSGQVPARPADSWPVEGFDDQIRQAITNLIAVVEAGGGKKENLIKNVVFLKDMKRFDQFNRIYSEFFPKTDNPPARSCFGVSALAGPYDIEIEAVAYLGSDRQTLRSSDAPVFDLPFCQGIRAEEMVFVSGQVGFNPKTGEVPGTFEGQTRQMMENMLAVAREAGAGPDDFVKTTCFLTDIRKFEFFNKIYREYFRHDFPARSAFQVAGLAYDYVVEIDGIACVGKPASGIG